MDFDGRGATRIESENLLSFRLFDKDDNVCNEGMVKTLDISRTGIAIQAQCSMQANQKIEFTVGMGVDIVKTTGIVKNVKKIDDDYYQIGIEFDFLTEEDLNKIGMIYPNILK